MKNFKYILSKISGKSLSFVSITIIFGILIIQSGLNLFVDVAHENISQIDIIFRTATSSIFGYIMSVVSTSDFAFKEREKSSPNPKKSIGFSAEETQNPSAYYNEVQNQANSDIQTTEAPKDNFIIEKKNFKINIQIVVLTLACIYCLVMMLIVRNLTHLFVVNSTNTVTISQYRDIISGSIGALIGLSRSK